MAHKHHLYVILYISKVQTVVHVDTVVILSVNAHHAARVVEASAAQSLNVDS